MSLRHSLRNTLLSLNYLHLAAVAMAIRRGPQSVKQYLSEMYRCSKTDAGLYLPIVTLEEIASVSTEFVVSRPPDWGGSMTLTEISSLCHLVAARRPRKILEIGSFRGLTTLNLAMNAPDAEVHTLDLPPDANPASTRFQTNDTNIITSRDGYHYAGCPEANRIVQHYGDTATFDYKEIGSGVDFCLIDAAHSYEYVRNDTAKTLPLLSDGGLMLWHDYGRNDFLADPEDAWGVTRFLHEIADTGVGILQGTSLGILSLTADVKQKLARRLGISLASQ
jgi:predicted O-methyltransferase YrrM